MWILFHTDYSVTDGGFSMMYEPVATSFVPRPEEGKHPVFRSMRLLPATKNCGLQMHRECRERFPHHRLQRKPLVSDPGMHHGTCVAHVP